MKYYFQFEGNEKLAINLILIGISIIIILLAKIAFMERPIYTYFDETKLVKIFMKDIKCHICHKGS